MASALIQTCRRCRNALRVVADYIAANGGGMRGVIALARYLQEIMRYEGVKGLFVRLPDESTVPLSISCTPGTASLSDRVERHSAVVDIVVCVHNALTEAKTCLASVIRYSSHPYTLIIIDDGSEQPTRSYLEDFATSQRAMLIRNEAAKGYTLAANQGLRAATGEYVVLLNSDTIVTAEWLDRLVMCAGSDRQIGMVGPLSNTASWQSIPSVEVDGDWAANPLPEGMTVEKMGNLLAACSGRVYPRITFLNGFCLLIKRGLIDDIGLFDEELFGRGYGEENDYALRARDAGWSLAVADDTYVYHAQSKSYSTARRRELSALAGVALAGKHDERVIAEGVLFCRQDRVLNGMRRRVGLQLERRSLLDKARELWEGKRVAFVLPLPDAGGGGNVVISETLAMVRMGVDACIVNLASCREGFEREYGGLSLPVHYAANPYAVPALCEEFDAVVATTNYSVQWLRSLAERSGPVLGYYIQDYEPFFYPENSRPFREALDSYRMIPGIRRFTKTRWNQETLAALAGCESHLVGPSCDIDLFRPRMRHEPSWPARPLRIVAMIRPSSPRRNARLTMEVLRDCAERFANQVEIVIFGVDADDPEYLSLPRELPLRNVGRQRPLELALLFNNADVFVDFSVYQAMGLTAMEAMSCGVAVIVPRTGGAESFAVHEKNALVIDTDSAKDCLAALCRLIEDHTLRTRLQRQALTDLPCWYPEAAAFEILKSLFGET